MSNTGPEIIFYDGECGFCHRWVKFVLAVDTKGELFHFAPRQSQYYDKNVPAEDRLQETIVVKTNEGVYLDRSSAVAHILKRLGGFWTFLGGVLELFPLFLRDTGYRLVSKIRKGLMSKPDSVCPIVPPELRSRFLSD